MTPNYDSLEFRAYTSKSETDKALNTLQGLLVGMGLDGTYNESELKELDNWCSKHMSLINRNPFKEFMQLIKQAVNKPDTRQEAMEDLKWMCQKYEQGNIYYSTVTSDLQILQGICHGIIADGKIQDDEIYKLDSWLDENAHLQSFYPYDEIACLVSSVLRDKVIDEDERRMLLAYFNDFCLITTPELSKKIKQDTESIKITAICTMDPNVEFDGKGFCFTGVASKAPREELIKSIKQLGGIYTDNVSKKTDYLIVGDNGNPCWAFARYGRKVEKAIELRKQGHKISIVHEYSFWDFI